MNTKTRAKLILGGVALALIAASILAIRLANHTLEAAGARRLPCPDADYAWISNYEILTFLTKHASVPNRYDPSVKEDVVTVSAQKSDIFSGFAVSLNGFTANLTTKHSSDLEHWSVSPDGKRLMYGLIAPDRDYDGDDYLPLSIFTMDSGRVETVDDEVYVGINYDADSAVWMPDNSRLLLAKGSDGVMAALYNTESEDDASVAIPLEVHTPMALGVTPDDRLIYTDLTDPNPRGIPIFAQDIRPSEAAIHVFTPRLPDGATVKEISLSPAGDNLAWLTSSMYTPPGYRLVKRILPQMAAKMAPYPVMSIYTSKLDGTDMRLLGMESNPPDAPEEKIQNMRWRPDGKSLSFRWHTGIYLVPAE